MSFTLREDIPSLHSVIRCPDYEPSSYCTAPIGVTYINQGADGVTHYRHFLQPAGNHDFLFVQAARYYSRLLGRQLSSDDEKIIRHGASPELNHLTCLTDLIITGYFYQPDNTPVAYCSYREIAECPDAPHDPETSRYIAELGAYGLWSALDCTPREIIFLGGEAPLTLETAKLPQAAVEVIRY